MPSEADQTPLDNLRGIVLAAISTIFASAMALLIRAASDDMSAVSIAGMRSSLMLIAIAISLILVTRWREQIKFSNPKMHILRGVLFGLSTHLGFYTLTVIPLTTATVLFFTAPIFAALFGVILKGDRMGPRRTIAILIGFVGAIIIIRPGFIPLNFGMMTALLSSLLFGAALAMSNNLARTDGALSTLLSSTVLTVLVSIPLVANDFTWPTNGTIWFFLLGLAAVSMGRQVSDIQAYKLAEATVLAPISYLRLIFIGIGAYLFFDEVPDRYTFLGAIVIISAVLYVSYRERRARKLLF